MTCFASIPIFDWNGPEFLGFYAAAFVVALVWSLFRRFHVNDKFSLPSADETSLTDPYEIGYLAGGGLRCAQLVVVRLIKAGAIEWRKGKWFRESKLVAVGAAKPEFNEVERTVFSSILSYGKSGMALDQIPPLVATKASSIETRLAILGLRPTASESRGRGYLVSLPLIFMLGIGIVKLLVGLSRDKPVGFLIVFLIVTVLTGIFVGARLKKLTPAGERLLDRMRGEARVSPAGSQDAMLCGVALLGVSAMASDESLVGLDFALKKQLSNMGNSNARSCSSGCSSGCGGGGGGCGGGGCGGGGCGGCGGD